MKEIKAAFLDRDGTINVEKNYIKTPDEIELIDGSAEAIKRLNIAGYTVFGVTNQSGVARGMMTLDDVYRTNERTMELVSEGGGEIREIFYCPHHKDGIAPEFSFACECRKPSTGMIRQAAEKYGHEFSEIIVVGDKICDVELGKKIGAKTALVLTGHGMNEKDRIEADGGLNASSMPDYFAKDLAHAVELILAD